MKSLFLLDLAFPLFMMLTLEYFLHDRIKFMRIQKFLSKYLLPLFFLCIATLSFTSSNCWAGIFGDESRPLPSFSLPTLANTSKQLTNKTLLGRVSLLNVWASWCRYCMNEHPMLMKIKNTGTVPIYGIAFRDNPENARAFLKTNGNPYTSVGVDWSGDVSASLDVSGTPQTFIVDKHGVIRDHYSGSLDDGRWEEISKKVSQYKAES